MGAVFKCSHDCTAEQTAGMRASDMLKRPGRDPGRKKDISICGPAPDGQNKAMAEYFKDLASKMSGEAP